MKYVLLDTNIIIDLVVDRQHNRKNNLFDIFLKLLDNGEVKLVVPDIIIEETKRNLETEVGRTRGRISDVIKALKGLHNISTDKERLFDFEEDSEKFIKKLNAKKDEFEKNEIEIKEKTYAVINKLFEHENIILIPYDDFLGSKVMKRRIYKRAPFHIEKKESYADGLIIETLINMKKYINWVGNNRDHMYFVSRNTEDFCESSNNKKIHHHIKEDIESNGFISYFTFKVNFAELIHGKLKEQVKKAGLTTDAEIAVEQYSATINRILNESIRGKKISEFSQEDLKIYKDFVNEFLERHSNRKLRELMEEIS